MAEGGRSLLRFDVEPGSDGLIPLHHEGIGAKSVHVRCLRRDERGQEVAVGYLFHTVITRHDIEVATVPGSGVVAVLVEPLDDGT